MANVELVIKIPEDVYKRTVFYREFRDLSDCIATIKALEQAEPTLDKIRNEKDILKLLEKTYDDFCKCEGGEGWLKIDGKEYDTDTGYAIEGMRIFVEVFKRRLVECDN